jgi:AGCS family alanine or glycine:cation symporter
MKTKLLLIILLFSINFSAFSQEETSKEMGIADRIEEIFKPISDAWSAVIFYSIPLKEDKELSVTIIDDVSNEQKVLSLKRPWKFKYDFDKNHKYRIITFLPDEVGTKYEKIVPKDADGQKVLDRVSEKIASFDLKLPIVLILLILGALYFTLFFKIPQFKLLKTAVKVVAGKYDNVDSHGSDTLAGDPTPNEDGDIPETIKIEGEDGEVSHFQALSAALSATVGLGNIAGVAVAIAIGGPGATFWMILAGLLGMASKFTECTLGVKYRDVDENGTVYGGPMYYLKKGLGELGYDTFGKFLAVFFAIMVVGASFGGGNMFQANQSAAQFVQLFGINNGDAGFYFGIVLAIIVGVVIIGGIKRIGKVAEKIVPFMAVLYVGAALIILVMNLDLIPKAFSIILSSAFTPMAGLGGFMGVLIQGFKRGTFSNEAGVGSAAIAHSAVKTNYPASEGIVALLEPFIDTVVICTMTALVLIITNLKAIEETGKALFTYGDDAISGKGVELTAAAFDSSIPHFSIILTIAVILFAFSTMLSWSYYGLQGWKFIFGRGKKADMIYKLLFLFFVVIGASVKLGSVIVFSDAMIFAMVFPNIIGLVFLAPKVREELVKYLKAIKAKHGKV